MEQVPDDEEHLWEILSAALEEAAKKFVASREVEGAHLKEDLLGKLDYMTGLVDFIEERSPVILKEYRQDVYKRQSYYLCDQRRFTGLPGRVYTACRLSLIHISFSCIMNTEHQAYFAIFFLKLAECNTDLSFFCKLLGIG